MVILLIRDNLFTIILTSAFVDLFIFLFVFGAADFAGSSSLPDVGCFKDALPFLKTPDGVLFLFLAFMAAPDPRLR